MLFLVFLVLFCKCIQLFTYSNSYSFIYSLFSLGGHKVTRTLASTLSPTGISGGGEIDHLIWWSWWFQGQLSAFPLVVNLTCRCRPFGPFC